MSIKYKAFISYSHADGRAGPRLHAWLESYRVPKPLVGGTGRTGPVPERLNPIFIDRAELPTSSNLSEVIVDALEQSEFLVVICSPNAARSRWVNEEVLTFRRLGRSDRVLCYIIGGEPNAAEKPDLGRAECFPPAIRFELSPEGQLTEGRTEPIAADQRREGDGTRRARLKIVAGLTGLNFGDLWPREEYRRRRTRNARLAAVTIMTGVFAILAWATYTATQESRQQSQLAQVNSASRLRTEYFNQIAQANLELGRSHSQNAQELLAACDPALRGWEWHYLLRVADTSAAIRDEHEGGISAAALSPDGSYLISVGVESITIWDAVTGQLIRQLTDRKEVPASYVAFSPDGRWFVTGATFDKKMRLWDVTTGSELTSFGDQPGIVMSVAYSPAGTHVASGDMDGNVAVWNIDNGKRAALLTEHKDAVAALAFSPDGTQLATAGFDTKIIIWNILSMSPIRTLKGHEFKIHSLAFSPSGDKLASGGSDDTVRIWDVASGATEAIFRGHRGTVMALAFDDTGERLVSAGEDATVRIWNVTEKSAATVLMGHTDRVNSVMFDHRDGRLISASSDGTIRYWDANINPRVAVLNPPTGVPTTLSFAKGGDRFTVVSENWSVSEKVAEAIDRISDTDILREAGKSTRSLMRAGVATPSTLTTIWNIDDGRVYQIASEQSYVVVSYAHSPVDTRFLTCHEKVVAIWREEDAKPTRWLEGHEGEVRWAEFSPDASRVASRDATGVLIVWDADTGARQLKIDPANGNKVTTATFSPDASMIAVCDRDGLVQVWDITNGSPIRTLGGETRYRAAAFSPDSGQIALGSEDFAIHVFATNGGDRVMKMMGHQGAVNTLLYLPDGSRIFSGAEDGTIKLWDVISGMEVHTLSCDRTAVNLMAMSPDGNRLLAGGTEQTAKLYEALPLRTRAMPAVGVTAQVDETKQANAEAIRLLTEAIGEIRQLTNSKTLLEEALIALTKAGAAETARMAIRDYFDEIAAGSMLAVLGRAQAEAGDIEGALEAVDKIPYELIRDSGYAYIAEACAFAGDIVRAEHILTRIESPINRNKALASIASAYARESDYEQMDAALNAMSADDLRDWDINRVVLTLSGLEEVERAFAVADKIRDKVQKGYAQRTVISGMVKQGRIADALATVDRMEDTVQADAAWCGIAITQAETGDVRGAQETLRLVTPSELRDRTTIDIAEALVRHGDDALATETINALPEKPRDAGRWRLAITHAELGQVEFATKLAETLDGSKNGIWSTLAVAQARRNDFEKAIEYFDRIENSIDQAHCVKAVAAVWSATGDRAAARTWVDELNDPEVHAHGVLGIALGAMPPELVAPYPN